MQPTQVPQPHRARSRAVTFALLAIVLLALVLRVYGLRHLVYSNPDEALFSYFVVRVAQLSPVTLHPAENALANILSWDYGWPLYLVDYAYLRALSALHVPVNEATLALPMVAFGTLLCLLVFLLGRRYAGARAGLLAAAFVAVLPIFVEQARSIGTTEPCSGFLFLLAVLQAARYFEHPQSGKRQWLAGLCVGLYLCGDPQIVIGGLVLLLFTVLWPRAQGYEGLAGWRRLVLRPGILIPPVVLFSPLVAAYVYAVHLGYPDQTYLGSILNGHKADWGFHLLPFLADLARNMGLVPLLLLPIALLLPGCVRASAARDPRFRWLLCWIGVTALPFLFAVTSKVTEVYGYHEHLVTGLALLLAVAVAGLRPRAVGIALASVAVAGALAFTLGGVLRIPPFPSMYGEKVPYGGLPPNNGMKTAGYWVRQNVPANETVFVAHDPGVAYWYLGREGVIGGYGAGMVRAESFLAHKDQVQVAVIPDQRQYYPPALFAQNGFPGHLVVRSDGKDVLDIYTRKPLHQTLNTEQLDPLFARTYRTLSALIPPGAPYVPGKRISGVD